MQKPRRFDISITEYGKALIHEIKNQQKLAQGYLILEKDIKDIILELIIS